MNEIKDENIHVMNMNENSEEETNKQENNENTNNLKRYDGEKFHAHRRKYVIDYLNSFSEISLGKFAKKNNLKYSTFYGWIKSYPDLYKRYSELIKKRGYNYARHSKDVKNITLKSSNIKSNKKGDGQFAAELFPFTVELQLKSGHKILVTLKNIQDVILLVNNLG